MEVSRSFTSLKAFAWLFSYISVVLSTRHGTFINLSTVIKGRCMEYQNFNEVGDHEDFSVNVNCDELWRRFRNSFRNKHICNVTEEDYDEMFQMFKDSRKSDKILFWSGTKKLAHEFSSVNDNYITLEDTFAGYIADQLQWCGCTSGTQNCSTEGINFKSCAKSCPDGRSFVNKPYWSRASRVLSEKAVDVAHVILNGTQTGYYTAYWTGREKCAEGTLVQLEEDAKRYGIPEVECHDNPTMVMGILCAKYPKSERCKRLGASVKNQTNFRDMFLVSLILTIIFLLTSVILVVILYVSMCRRNRQHDIKHSTNQSEATKSTSPVGGVAYKKNEETV